MSLVVGAMVAVLAIAVGVVIAVLIGMGRRSWLWAPKMFRLARRGARLLRRQAVRYADRGPTVS